MSLLREPIDYVAGAKPQRYEFALDAEESRGLSRRVAIIACVAFALLSAYAANAGRGFLEADGCTHYLYARFASTHQYLFVNIWGRPLVTGLYALPAMIGGRAAVRWTSLCIALLTAGITLRIAVNQRYRMPAIAAIFLFAQPLFFLHSAAELTELPFALIVTAALWAYQRRKFFWLAVIVSIMPLGRPEAFGFMLAATAAFILHRKPWWILILPIPIIEWSYVGWTLYGSPADMHWWQWLIRNWPYEAQSNYGHGALWWYVAFLPTIVGPALVPAVLAGGLWCWRYGRLFSSFTLPVFRARLDASASTALGFAGGYVPRQETSLPENVSPGKASGRQARSGNSLAHLRRCDFVLAALPFGILLVHSVFWFFGKFSGGELRYLLIVGPMWALTAARGWEWIGTRWSNRALLFATIAIAVAPAACDWFYTAVPVHMSEPENLAAHLADWYQHNAEVRSLYPKLTSPQTMFYYEMDLCPWKDRGVVPWTRAAVEQPTDGTLMVYDPILATFNSDSRLIAGDDSLKTGSWVLLKQFDDGWRIYLSPHDASGRASDADTISQLP